MPAPEQPGDLASDALGAVQRAPTRGAFAQRTDALQRVKQLWPLPGRPHKVEWHQGELYPRVGFIVTNLTGRPSG